MDVFIPLFLLFLNLFLTYFFEDIMAFLLNCYHMGLFVFVCLLECLCGLNVLVCVFVCVFMFLGIRRCFCRFVFTFFLSVFFGLV